MVKGDPVDGKDTHVVAGSTTSSPPTPYSGTGKYTYGGEVVDGFSGFVTIGGTPLAVVTSASRLRAAGATDHSAPKGSGFVPPTPPPAAATLTFVPPTGVGAGRPSSGVGSRLLTVAGTKALLDGDAFDTCGIPGGRRSCTVAAEGQGFVTCSA